MNGSEAIDVVTDAVTSHSLSMFSLFAEASWTVKFVILLLIGCSLWCWTIIFAKISMLKKLKQQADSFEYAFWNCTSIDTFYEKIESFNNDDPFVLTFIMGMKEWRRAKNHVRSVFASSSIKERIENLMHVTIMREIKPLENHVGFLATVGSTAPFVGLFGTVWGIMNSFESIGIDQNTSLTSVAPGIAEALFATALGLVVTIPAVIAYNKISSDIERYQNRLLAFIDEFSAIVSRQLESNAYEEQRYSSM